MADHYDLGEPYARRYTFRNNAGVLADPSGVQALVLKPDGLQTTYTYPSAELTKESTGVYLLAAAADQVGYWQVKAIGTGAVEVRELDEFIVDPDPFAGAVLNADALTTVYAVERFLARTGQQGTLPHEKDDRAWIRDLINEASSAIRDYTRRQFKPQQNDVEKRFRYDGRGYLSFEPYELRDLTSIILYTDLPTASRVTLQAGSGSLESDYRLEPRQKTPIDTWLWMSLPTFELHGDDVAEGREVTILGDWGGASVPAAVERACKLIVADWYLNPTGLAAVQIGGQQLPEFSDRPRFAFPLNAVQILDRWKR